MTLVGEALSVLGQDLGAEGVTLSGQSTTN